MKLSGYITFILTLTLIIASCVTNKKTTYLQQLEQSDIPLESVTPEIYQVFPTDNLHIRVMTPDPKWSAIFNTMPSGGGTINVTESAVGILSYTVYSDGTIDFPYVGSIHVAGKTLREIRTEVENKLVSYINDAVVTVKLVNNYISLIGEVQQPGMYLIYKENLNIFQALAMAGDMDIYSNLREVQVIRQSAEGPIIKSFNMTDERIVGSEFYYVMPNDVIYAKPMKGKFFKMESFPYTLILGTVTTFVLMMSWIN
jgi:polysaccharide export outer membrane protein